MPRDLFESNLTQAVDDGAPCSHQVTPTGVPYTADFSTDSNGSSWCFERDAQLLGSLTCVGILSCGEKTCWWDAEAWYRDQTSKADTVSVLISSLALLLVRLKLFHPESVRASGVY